MSWVTLQYKIVKTRKPHRCFGCERTFLPGGEMRVSVGMWQGDPPSRTYTCRVCEAWLSTQDLISDDPLPEDNWMHDYEPLEYAVIEGQWLDYIRRAGVLTQWQDRAMRDMYDDLRRGERWREHDARKAVTA